MINLSTLLHYFFLCLGWIDFICGFPIQWEAFSEEGCVFHHAGYYSPYSRISEVHEELLKELTANYLSYFLTPANTWGYQPSNLDYMEHNPRFQLKNGCIIFLLFEPNVQNIAFALSDSGYGVNLEALFFIFWTDEWYNSTVNYPGGWWSWDIGFTDSRILFIIDGRQEIGLFCYFCDTDERVQFLHSTPSETFTLSSVKKAYDQLNRNVRTNYVTIGNFYIDFSAQCTYDTVRLYAEVDKCVTERFLIEILQDTFNFSVQHTNMNYHSLFSLPAVNRDHHMLIFVGPLGRGRFFNNTKQYVLNSTVSYLLYCVDTAERESIFTTLLTPFAPFDYYTWTLILAVTISFILLIRPRNHILYWTIILRISPPFSSVKEIRRSWNDSMSTAFLVFLLASWSLMSSNLLTNYYEGFISSEIMVPLPQKTISTFTELLQRGYKIVLPGEENKIYEALERFKFRFESPELKPYAHRAFENLSWDHQVLDYVFFNPGKKSTYQYLGELGSSMEYLRGMQMGRKAKSVECHVIPEIYGSDDNSWMFLFHMSSKFYECMGWISSSGIIDFLQSLRIHFRVQLKRLINRQGGFSFDEEKEHGLTIEADSKLIFVFLIYCFMIIMSFIVFIVECRLLLNRANTLIMVKYLVEKLKKVESQLEQGK
jgi:hypothetical protein